MLLQNSLWYVLSRHLQGSAITKFTTAYANLKFKCVFAMLFSSYIDSKNEADLAT